MKFRKWLFRFLFDYDIEYFSGLLSLADEVNKKAEKVNNEAKEILNLCGEVNRLSQDVMEHSREMIAYYKTEIERQKGN